MARRWADEFIGKGGKWNGRRGQKSDSPCTASCSSCASQTFWRYGRGRGCCLRKSRLSAQSSVLRRQLASLSCLCPALSASRLVTPAASHNPLVFVSRKYRSSGFVSFSASVDTVLSVFVARCSRMRPCATVLGGLFVCPACQTELAGTVSTTHVESVGTVRRAAMDQKGGEPPRKWRVKQWVGKSEAGKEEQTKS